MSAEAAEAAAIRTADRGWDEADIPQPILGGEREDEDEEGTWTMRWYVYEKADLIARGYDLDTCAEDLLGPGSYNGPGRWFWSTPYAIVGRTRVLIKQSGGLDI